ncbi:MAG: UbiD family decarboxylase [Planctomycetaceae bacterium]
MGYRNLQECVRDLERTGQLRRVDVEIDAHLEAAAIQRRAYQADSPAILFTRVKNCKFPLLCNLFGTRERAQFIFRDALEAVRHLIELKADPGAFASHPWRYRDVPRSLWTMRPRFVSRGPVLDQQTTLDQLPPLQCWPKDGGAFITLPQVYTEDPDHPGWRFSNLGMYRIQFTGGAYQPNREVGLHYQIHRTIGVHHAAAIRNGERLRVNIFIGGSPAMTLAAVMPLPENLTELMFAGALSRRRVAMIRRGNELPIAAEADFCISGTIDPARVLPEGPFGDHLGYYSLQHDFPVIQVDKVYHRRDAIWLFTSVGRPPQEDTVFGELIHDLTGPAIPTVLPGIKAVHAVDAAGVHPLLLAIGSERYVPYASVRQPQELLTQANAILGQGQLSLAKYLLIAAQEDDQQLDIHDIGRFFRHILERIDWSRDLHFQTRTTIDTLDYTGTGLNEGSKVVFAAAGPKRRELATELPANFSLPNGFCEPAICQPGILAVTAPRWSHSSLNGVEMSIEQFTKHLDAQHPINRFPLIVLVDDSRFTAESLYNFLWVTFTRSNPASDIHGIDSFIEQKHWGCRGSLIIDARIKPHHAPPLEEDLAVLKKIEALAVRGGPLKGLI